ncbi:response regulator [Nostoc parmelioides]|uniref:Protein PatA n=1 Tax=Nostoc parmelioides FACHB-3921 TaxID=2692909 RepID=A0ABR8BB05_9NOSO|nr:response regulator [Nostoc parmelioides]MBD2250935.1 response regulator [Nostoc parmelioides FACHB-3921]
MKTLPITRYRFFQKIQPLSLLKKITGKTITGCLQVFSTSGTWSIYVEEGKLIYACYSERMFEPLYRHLGHLSPQITTLPKEINEQLRAIFETGIENQAIPNPDYLAICWLVNQKYISSSQAAVLIEQLALEVIESFLLLEEGSYEFIPESFLDDLPKFCYLNVRLLVEQCQQHGRVPEAFRREASSQEMSSSTESNQIPVNSKRSTKFTPPPHTQPKPEPRLPQINTNKSIEYSKRYVSPSNTVNNGYSQISPTSTDKKIYKIFCIDDDPIVLNSIKNFLDDQIFAVIGVTDSLKALMEILCTKPDIIFINVDMPDLDGYELCSLLRKHSYFKNTPVIMVTEKAGLVDRARAKIVRASGHLNKSFNQGDLLKVIFKHIT